MQKKMGIAKSACKAQPVIFFSIFPAGISVFKLPHKAEIVSRGTASMVGSPSLGFPACQRLAEEAAV